MINTNTFWVHHYPQNSQPSINPSTTKQPYKCTPLLFRRKKERKKSKKESTEKRLESEETERRDG